MNPCLGSGSTSLCFFVKSEEPEVSCGETIGDTTAGTSDVTILGALTSAGTDDHGAGTGAAVAAAAAAAEAASRNNTAGRAFGSCLGPGLRQEHDDIATRTQTTEQRHGDYGLCQSSSESGGRYLGGTPVWDEQHADTGPQGDDKAIGTEEPSSSDSTSGDVHEPAIIGNGVVCKARGQAGEGDRRRMPRATARTTNEELQLVAELSDYFVARGGLLVDRRAACGAARVCLDLLRRETNGNVSRSSSSSRGSVGPVELFALADAHLLNLDNLSTTIHSNSSVSSSTTTTASSRLLELLVSGNVTAERLLVATTASDHGSENKLNSRVGVPVGDEEKRKDSLARAPAAVSTAMTALTEACGVWKEARSVMASMKAAPAAAADTCTSVNRDAGAVPAEVTYEAGPHLAAVDDNASLGDVTQPRYTKSLGSRFLADGAGAPPFSPLRPSVKSLGTTAGQIDGPVCESSGEFHTGGPASTVR